MPNVTLPMLSPFIFFMLVIGLIGAFASLTQAWMMRVGTGGNADSTMLYPIGLFQHASQVLNKGYACAMAWLMSVVVVAAIALLFRSSARCVYYAGSQRPGIAQS
ncbi:MAG TPA: hypothetical protein VLH79_13860, partial [Chthonomonadales bacterium]|nr:hypothetical protein [Chthonomonadales bacterium]